MLALEWVPRVPHSRRAELEEAARAAGFPDFRFVERTESGEWVAAGERREYFPVYLVEPLRGNEPALGLDLAADPVRRAALEAAREHGALRASAPIRLPQEPDELSGFLVALPVHAKNGDLSGFVVAVYVVDEIVAQAARHGTVDMEGLEVELADAAAPPALDRLYNRPFAQSDSPSAVVGPVVATIDVAGRPWRLRATPSAAYVAARRGDRPLSVLLAGLFLTSVVGFFLELLGFRANAVKRLVLTRTADLTRANASLEEQRSVLQSVLDNLGDGVAMADESGRLVLLNPAAERILGVGYIDSRPDEWSELYGLYRPDGRTPLGADELPLAQAVAGRESRDVDIFVRNPEREKGVFVRVTATPVRDPRGKLRGGVAVFRDITERKWAEIALRESEERFRSIVEATGSALIILSPDHRILEFNPAAERIYGRTRAEVLAQDYFELFLPKEYWGVVAADIERTLKGETTLDLEIPVRAGDASHRVMLLRIGRLTSVDGGVIGVVATGHDITERREAEEAQRVRQLAAHLQSAREAERKHAAREIHDELGQALTGLKFEFSHLARRLVGVEPALREKIAGLERLIDGTIGSVRRIAAELRPQILDQLGLLEAIRWQAQEFHKRTGIVCSVELPAGEIDWSQDRSTAVFRIFQESLTNVTRHSGAGHVAVRISVENSQVVLEVKDDGRGIREDELANERSFGLMGMRERARMFGGVLTVRGTAADGTTVRVQIPV